MIPRVWRCLIPATAIIFASGAAAAERFQKLTGGQIQARIAGIEMTDGVHSRDIFERNGTLSSFSMRRKSSGKWRVQRDELCIERGKEESRCYQVWVADKKVELRRQGLDLSFFEGVLQKPGKR